MVGRWGFSRLAQLCIACAVASVAIGTSGGSQVAANAADPYLVGNVWGYGFSGTFRYQSTMPLQWMRNEATAGVAVISTSPYRNPYLSLTTSSSANVNIGMRNSSSSSCAGSFGWVACAEVRGSWTVWYVDLTTTRCWMNGGQYRTCSTTATYDVWTLILVEMLHVNTLNHHVNPDRSDAVSQGAPIAYPNSGWQDRALRWADNSALYARFGSDPCTMAQTQDGAAGPLRCIP